MVDVKKTTGEHPAQEPEKGTSSAAPGASPKPNINADDWNKKSWDSSSTGRLAIRTFSRGVMGAAFFAAGGLWSRKMMKQLDNPALEYNADKEFKQIVFEEKNPLQFIAKTIDTFVGRPIQLTVNYFGGNGLRATHFKPTKYKTTYESLGGHEVRGRSLGAETVFATFDFFCGSIGDAMARDIIGWVDPNVKKDWMDDKGNVKWSDAVKSLTKSMWRYVSLNGGEDWAVAIPYVYFVKWQRNLIDKHITPGYAFESDIAMNASSLKTNTRYTPHQVVGSYSMEAMLDYQGRFTAYNIGTLMYRELYDKAAQALSGNHINLYGDPHAQQDPNKGVVGKGMDIMKWGMRSVLKAAIYMTPSIPFFSITRATQNRGNALFIDPVQRAALGFESADGKMHFITASDLAAGTDGLTRNTPVHYAHYVESGRYHEGIGMPLGEVVTIPRHDGIAGTKYSANDGNPSVRISRAGKPFSPYTRRHNMVENFFSWIGEMNANVTNSVRAPVDKFGETPIGTKVRNALGLYTNTTKADGTPFKPDSLSRFSSGMINAAISYTPYMYAKGEFAKLWDNGKTDLALERTIDGALGLNWKEFKAGVGETVDAVLHRPFADATREKLADYRLHNDTSAADDLTAQQAQRSNENYIKSSDRFAHRKEAAQSASAQEQKFSHRFKSQADDIPWQKRVVQGAGGDGASLMDTKHTPTNHAEREEMRQFLQEAEPPTSSRH